MKTGKLEIYHNGKKTEEIFTFEGDEAVNAKLADILISKEVRGNKTRIQAVPYTDELKVTQTFVDAQLGTYVYKYHFYGVRH